MSINKGYLIHKVVLASNVSSIQEFIKAKNIIFKIAQDIKDGVLMVTKTIRAIFVGAHKKALQRRYKHPITNKPSEKEESLDLHTVPFYNWLTDRDEPTEVF